MGFISISDRYVSHTCATFIYILNLSLYMCPQIIGSTHSYVNPARLTSANSAMTRCRRRNQQNSREKSLNVSNWSLLKK